MRSLAIGGFLLLLGAAAGFWAGRVALSPPEDPLTSEAEPVTYEVLEQTLGRSLTFSAVAEWETSPLVRAWRPGVVTSVDFMAGDAVDAGDRLYTVDLRPVVVARGEVPAFRDLQVGETGADVGQLNAMLAELGFLSAEPDDTFEDATVAAVRAWQRSLGVEDDGVVQHGDLVFAPELPVRVVATGTLITGTPLAGGEVVVERLSFAPRIVVPLTSEQRTAVPLSGAVRLTYADGTWDAVIARAAESSEQGAERLDLVLEAPDGGAVCGEDCAEWIPPLGRTDFEAVIVVVPETTGPVVPTAAILTSPGGEQSVRLVDGEQLSIEVVVSTGGLAVVSGIEVGDVLVMPFADPPPDG